MGTQEPYLLWSPPSFPPVAGSLVGGEVDVELAEGPSSESPAFHLFVSLALED